MITVSFDGACSINPNGIGAIGFIIKKNGNFLHKYGKVIGEGEGMTNNVCEYNAILSACPALRAVGSNIHPQVSNMRLQRRLDLYINS